MRFAIFSTLLILVPLVSLRADEPASATADPLAAILRPHLKSTVSVLLKHYRTQRKYENADFPMPKRKFDEFKAEIRSELAASLGVTDWVVRSPRGKASPIAQHYEDRLLKTIHLHGVRVELHAVTLHPTGLVVPMAVCLPAGDAPAAGVCVFSGHTSRGLHDLVVNTDSYQQGAAIRLAQAGFISIAVEKIDTGYLSRHGSVGNDENVAATLMLSWGSVLRSHQLRACLAATEILAGHARTDEAKIGATGVSLGGWLAVQTAMLNDRIGAVADFGRKTRSVRTDLKASQYKGQGDLCHIIPGMLRLSDRNLLPVVLAPLPMLAGHGRKDAGSHKEHAANFRAICEAQYDALGASANYSYLIHGGGDTMPSKEMVAWFNERFSD
ncbi:MAG: dienelactone hydrolase family protein [Pirellulaceae bacterium]|jgi:dienelactone hydrolase|nr:dienelactone hydrolase family protein [Pirellulaceae bacterium]MDP7020555.1 dienelactone hydrolase family protein [Pirellulaceae bacterium]